MNCRFPSIIPPIGKSIITNDLTIDLWLKVDLPQGEFGEQYIFPQNDIFNVSFNSEGTTNVYIKSRMVSMPFLPSSSYWIHYACTRFGEGETKIFINGAEAAETVVMDYFNPSWEEMSRFTPIIEGQVEGFHIVKGVARWVSCFIPQVASTQELVDSGGPLINVIEDPVDFFYTVGMNGFK